MNTTLRALSAALAAALIAPSALGSPAMVVKRNGKRTSWAVWVMNRIPMVS